MPTSALRRGVREARGRELPLTVVHGCAAPFGVPLSGSALTEVRERMRAAVMACGGADLELDLVLSDTEATPALLAAAEGAALLVVGGRSRETAGRHLLGTVSGGCLQAARCPVMVVPAELPSTGTGGRIVVAVDEGGPAHAALAWAVAQARASRLPLEAVAVCPPGRDPDVLRASVRTALHQADADMWQDDLRVLQGPPVEAIASALHAEDLLVVGTRGHGSLIGLLLSSTSAALVARATCPTVVVRAGQARRELHSRREGDVGPGRAGRSPLVDDAAVLMG